MIWRDTLLRYLGLHRMAEDRERFVTRSKKVLHQTITTLLECNPTGMTQINASKFAAAKNEEDKGEPR